MIERTELGGHAEHFLAYACTAAVVALASTRGAPLIMSALIAYAGVLELLQRYSPGRTSSLGDFLFSAGGVLLGVGVIALSRRLRHSR
jgi:VanZ family protein